MSCRLFKIRKGSSKKYIYVATDSNGETIYWSGDKVGDHIKMHRYIIKQK